MTYNTPPATTYLIRDGAVLTPTGWLDPGYVQMEGERIAAVGAGAPPSTLAAGETLSARGKAVLPGLLNGHTHLSQTFMRGLAGGRPLLPWLKERIWPLQAAMTPEELHLAALLGLVENLRCGATTVVNHHKIARTAAHTDAVLAAARTVGLRVTLARAWADLGPGAESPVSILEDLERLFAACNLPPESFIRAASGPVALWRCSAETLRAACALARRYGAVTHAHVAETQDEVRMSLEMHGLRPVAWLDSLEVLGADTQIVHAVWVDEAEQDLLAARGATVVHCPVSNMVLGSGVAPIPALLRRGVQVRLGTDGPASNDTQDLFETLKAALLLARVSALDPTALAPAQALALATGGRTLHPGAPADLILVNLDHARAQPLHDLDSALALSTHGSDVETAFVGGRLLLREGHVLALDERALLEACRDATRALRSRAGL